MDAVLALALLSSGAFICVLIAALIYLWAVRPRLLNPPVNWNTLQSQQQEILKAVQEQRSAFKEISGQLLKNAEKYLNSSSPMAVLAEQLNQQSALVGSLSEKLMEQEKLLHQIQEQVMKTPSSEAVANLLGQQAAQLNNIAHHLQQIDDEIEENPDTESLYEQLLTYQKHLNDLALKLDAQEMAIQEVLRHQMKQPPETPRPDRPPVDLADIKGIGPVYAGLLKASGIDTFEKLAGLTPEQLRDTIKVPEWRRFDAESWIEQAKLYAAWLKELEQEA